MTDAERRIIEFFMTSGATGRSPRLAVIAEGAAAPARLEDLSDRITALATASVPGGITRRTRRIS